MTKTNIATKAAQQASEPFKDSRVSYDISSQASIDVHQVASFLATFAHSMKTSRSERVAAKEQAVLQIVAEHIRKGRRAAEE